MQDEDCVDAFGERLKGVAEKNQVCSIYAPHNLWIQEYGERVAVAQYPIASYCPHGRLKKLYSSAQTPASE